MEDILPTLLLMPFTLAMMPIFIFVPLYIFYPKGLAKIFNSIAKTDIIPTARLNKYIFYGLIFVVCALFVAFICMLFISKNNSNNTLIPSVIMLGGFILYFVVLYYIRRKNSLTKKAIFCEAYYSLLLIFTLVLLGIGLFYLGVIFFFIALGLLILYLCLGGVGTKIKVYRQGGILNSTRETLTHELDGEWRDGNGTAYQNNDNEWFPK